MHKSMQGAQCYAQNAMRKMLGTKNGAYIMLCAAVTKGVRC